MTTIPQSSAWSRVFTDVMADLNQKKREYERLKGELHRLNQFVVYIRDQVIALHQIDMFPYMWCKTAREAIQTYFELHPEDTARVPEIARALIDGGYTTSAARFNETVRMALLRMEDEREVKRSGMYWWACYDEESVGESDGGQELLRRLVSTRKEERGTGLPGPS